MTAHTMNMKLIGDGRYLCECPTCGRRVMLDTEPYIRMVLIAGDPNILHTGSFGGIEFGVRTDLLAPFAAWAEERGL